MMSRRRSFLVHAMAIAAALVWATAPSDAAAAGACDLPALEAAVRADPEAAAVGLAEAQLAGCFGIDAAPFCATGGPADTVCLAIRGWALGYQEPEPDLLALCEAAGALTAWLAEVAGTLPPSPAVATVGRRLADWQVDCRDPIGHALVESGAADWQVGGDLVAFGGADQVDVLAAVDAACPADAAGAVLADCVATTRSHFVLLALIGLQHDINSRLLGENLAATVQYVVDLDTRWDQYFTRGRALLPWEVALNGRLARPERGFNEPPSYQLILLHPSPVVTTSGFRHGSMVAGIALDLVGVYAWRWEGTRMRSPVAMPGWLGDLPLGGALTLVVDGNDDPGLGLVAYLPRNWSLGAAVKSDGDVRLLLSVDLAKLLIDPESQRQRLTRAFGAE
jgi:hypothetical protein